MAGTRVFSRKMKGDASSLLRTTSNADPGKHGAEQQAEPDCSGCPASVERES